MLCVYRISDAAQTSAVKPKLDHATKRVCLENFVNTFGKPNIILVADSVSDATFEELCGIVDKTQIVRTQFKSGAFSFLAAVKLAIDSGLPPNTPVYLCEDDYLHLPNANTFIKEGLEIADYVSVYDHPDKYLQEHVKPSRIFLTPSCHWRTAESTTMTFAARVSTLREDFDTYVDFCKSGYPHDHEMFLQLGGKGRTLVTSIPGASTHTELAWLSPFIEWNLIS